MSDKLTSKIPRCPACGYEIPKEYYPDRAIPVAARLPTREDGDAHGFLLMWNPKECVWVVEEWDLLTSVVYKEVYPIPYTYYRPMPPAPGDEKEKK